MDVFEDVSTSMLALMSSRGFLFCLFTSDFVLLLSVQSVPRRKGGSQDIGLLQATFHNAQNRQSLPADLGRPSALLGRKYEEVLTKHEPSQWSLSQEIGNHTLPPQKSSSQKRVNVCKSRETPRKRQGWLCRSNKTIRSFGRRGSARHCQNPLFVNPSAVRELHIFVNFNTVAKLRGLQPTCSVTHR